MTKPIELKATDVNKYLETHDYSALAIYIKNAFKLERNAQGIPIPYEFSVDVLNILHGVVKKIILENNENHKDITKDLFRSFRNYVVNSDVQTYLSNNDNFLNDVEKLFSAETNHEIRQIILQFLINLIISSEIAAHKIYDIFFKHIFDILKEGVIIYEASALLYNISIYKKLCLNFDMYACILELYESNSKVEFIHFLIEKFVTYESFWNYFKLFDIRNRLVILGIIRDMQIKGEKLNLPIEGVKTLTTHFVSSGDIIFQTISSKDSNLEPYEVSQLLQVISSLCANEDYVQILQNDKDLLINTGVLLINIHRLGKETKNYFTSIQSLSEIREPNKSIHEHPAFGFKGDLIRIIGNLCWKSKIMQDLVREAELIPVLLDCCNMDARNPFILQWVILAIHNFCENNLENQKIISEMHQEGTVSSSTLDEMGLTLNADGDNSLKIIPMEALRHRK